MVESHKVTITKIYINNIMQNFQMRTFTYMHLGLSANRLLLSYINELFNYYVSQITVCYTQLVFFIYLFKENI